MARKRTAVLPSRLLGERMIPMRQVTTVRVRDNADGTLHVWCDICQRSWPDVSDKNWPALHAEYHDNE
jgi:hypothetical protein